MNYNLMQPFQEWVRITEWVAVAIEFWKIGRLVDSLKRQWGIFRITPWTVAVGARARL